MFFIYFLETTIDDSSNPVPDVKPKKEHLQSTDVEQNPRIMVDMRLFIFYSIVYF